MNFGVIKKFTAALAIAASSFGLVCNANASLLTPAYEAQLATWLGQGPISFTNIYSGSTGDAHFNSTAWHDNVDGMGATFTLIEVPAGTYEAIEAGPTAIDRSIIGGYNPQSWNSSGDYNYTMSDAERTAFIYNLSTSILLRQILSTDDTYSAGHYQTYNHTAVGPAFGDGDLYFNNDFTWSYLSAVSYGTTFGPGLLGDFGGFLQGTVEGFPIVTLETYTFSTSTTDVPEPSTIALIAMAMLSMFGLGMMRRRADA